MLLNYPMYLYTWTAIQKIGAITVHLNTAYKGDMLVFTLNLPDVRCMFIHKDYLPNLLHVKDCLATLKTLIVYPEVPEEKIRNLNMYHVKSF